MRRKAEWIDATCDRDKYRLSHAEVLQRKVAHVSKNREVARQEWQARQELIRQGKIPEDLKKVIAPPAKKFSSKSTALKTEKKKPSPKPDSMPLEAPKSPKVVMLKTTNSHTRSKVERQDDPLDEISKLELAMKELENAMTEAIGNEEAGKGEALSDDSVFSISSEEEKDEGRYQQPQQVQRSWSERDVKPAADWLSSVLSPVQPSSDYYTPSYSYREEALKERTSEQGNAYPKPKIVEEKISKGWSLELGNEEDSVVEPPTADWENSEYLATLLEQTRKDLAFMSIAEPELSYSAAQPPSKPKASSILDDEPLPMTYTLQQAHQVTSKVAAVPYTQLPESYEDIPQPKAYTLRPTGREPVLRGKLSGQSLALIDHTQSRYII
mmetsp:Transcript_28801/g.51259  ORF Transcript_28801/g.51259 Transcript_28801/m.51259 type:complete len:383 (+) Transcript_28801:289-1437(+)